MAMINNECNTLNISGFASKSGLTYFNPTKSHANAVVDPTPYPTITCGGV
jgi:hypothetical protein